MAEVIATEILVKYPIEKRNFSMDFSSLMSSTETISSITSVTSEKIGGESSDLTITDEFIDGQTVTCWIEGGTKAISYRVKFVIVTSLGQILEGDGTLKVTNR